MEHFVTFHRTPTGLEKPVKTTHVMCIEAWRAFNSDMSRGHSTSSFG